MQQMLTKLNRNRPLVGATVYMLNLAAEELSLRYCPASTC